MAGIKSDVKESVLYLNDDSEMIYPCGHNVIFYNIAEKTQRYIAGIEGSQGITAMCLSYNKKQYLAIAEKHEKAPIVSIYKTDYNTREEKFKRKKVIVSQDLGKQEEIISMAFAPTKESLLITLTNEPD